MKNIYWRCAVGILFLLTVSLLPCPSQTNIATWLDPYVTNAMTQWHIPGLALVIVKDDQVTYMKGYGVCRAGSAEAVDTNTLFAIGSSSKAFTATAAGLLVQDGLLGWDDCVTWYLPRYQLYSESVTAALTIRDCLSMKVNLDGVCENLWYAADHGQGEILRRLAQVPAADTAFGTYNYRNPMPLTVGNILPAASGLTWEQIIQERIFQPLNMTRSLVSITSAYELANVAIPHLVETNGTVTAIPHRPLDNCAPAGAIVSSVNDMANWLRMQMAYGIFNGVRVVASNIIQETHTPQTLISTDPPSSYCMGWGTSLHRDRLTITHAGQIDGVECYVGMMPESRLGVVIVLNAAWVYGVNIYAHSAIMNKIFDMDLGIQDSDYINHYLASDLAEIAPIAAAWDAWEKQRLPGTSPSLPLNHYAMNYSSPIYGHVRIALEGTNLVYYHSSQRTCDLIHWQDDYFRGFSRRIGDDLRNGPFYYWFDVRNGEIMTMTNFVFGFTPAYDIAGNSAIGDFDGDRKADPAFYQAASDTWRLRFSADNYALVKLTNWFGTTGGQSAAADYDGDRFCDPAIYVSATSGWAARFSSTGYASEFAFPGLLGGNGWTAAPADYDGDHKADPAVYSASEALWRIRVSSIGYTMLEVFQGLGGTDWIAAPADYDGDGKTDPAVYQARASDDLSAAEGNWLVRLSAQNYQSLSLTNYLGGLDCVPVAADYDGDGKADPAVYNEGTRQWTFRLSGNQYTILAVTFQQ